MVVVLPHATVDGGVVHHAEVRLRIGVRVGIQVLLCVAEVGEVNGGEVLVEDLADIRGGKLFDHAERLVQSWLGQSLDVEVGEGVWDGVGARPGANGDVLPVGEAQPSRLLKEGGARLAKAQEEDGRGVARCGGCTSDDVKLAAKVDNALLQQI